MSHKVHQVLTSMRVSAIVLYRSIRKHGPKNGRREGGTVRSCLDEAKAVQVAAQLITLAGGRENYTKLIKLIYIADRESIARWDHSLTWDEYWSLKEGPIVSGIMDRIRGTVRSQHATLWEQHIRTEGYDVVIERDPGTSRLSTLEEALLSELTTKFKDYDWRAMIRHVHGFAEYKEPDSEDGRKPIYYSDILKAVGREGEAKELAKEFAAANFLRSTIGDC